MRMRHRQLTCAGDKALCPAGGTCASPTVKAPDACQEVVQRVPGLAGIDGQSDQPFGYAFSNRKLAFAESSLLECGGIVQRRVVRARFNALLVEHGVDEVIPGPAKLLGINLHGIKMADMFAART